MDSSTRNRLAEAMEHRLPHRHDSCRTFGRFLIERVRETGHLPEREECMDLFGLDKVTWTRWTRNLERHGMVVCHYGGYDLAPDVLSEGLHRTPILNLR